MTVAMPMPGGPPKPHKLAVKPRKPKRPKRASYYDPFAPVTNASLTKQLGVYGPTLTQGQINKQAASEAHAQITPLLAQIENEIKGRQGNAMASLGGATRSYMDAVGQLAPELTGAYDQARAQQGSVDDAINRALGAMGDTASTELGGKLAQIGAPASATGGIDVGQIGHGAGAAQFAQGSAELSRLIGDEAAAHEYGVKQPGIAANAGNQRAADLLGQYAQELGTRTGEVTTQLPGLIQGLEQNLISTNESRRQNKASLLENEKNRAMNAALGMASGLVSQTNASANLNRSKASVANARASSKRANVSVTNAQTSKQRANISAATAREKRAHDVAGETVSSMTAAERARHNRATETNNAAKQQAAGQKLHNQVDTDASRSRGVLIGKDGRPILRYKVKNGKRVKGTGRTIPFKEKPTSKTNTSSGTGPFGK